MLFSHDCLMIAKTREPPGDVWFMAQTARCKICGQYWVVRKWRDGTAEATRTPGWHPNLRKMLWNQRMKKEFKHG